MVQLVRPIPEQLAEHYEVLVENVQAVSVDEPRATIDGRELDAEEAFVPIFVSAEGCESE